MIKRHIKSIKNPNDLKNYILNPDIKDLLLHTEFITGNLRIFQYPVNGIVIKEINKNSIVFYYNKKDLKEFRKIIKVPFKLLFTVFKRDKNKNPKFINNFFSKIFKDY